MGNALTNTYFNKKVKLFNKIIENIMLNYIPHERITSNDRDSLG